MIDTQTGRIYFDDGLIVSPSTVVKDLAGFEDFKLTVDNGPWKSFSIRKILIAEQEISLSIAFYNNLISSLEMACSIDGYDSWENYSLEKEADRMKLNDQLFEKLTGLKPPQDFHWGSIKSLFDPRGGCSVLFIKYK